MSSCRLMFPGVSSLVFSGFGLKRPPSSFQSYLYSSLKTSPSIQHHSQNIQVKDDKFLHSAGHLDSFPELHGEDKREVGARGDPNEMRWNQKRREQASQQSLPYVCSTVWTAQRCSWSYTEKRRGRKETDVARRIKEGNQKERDPASNQFPKCSPQSRKYKEIHRVGQRREGGGRTQRRPAGEKGESKEGESSQASNLAPK